MNPIQSPITDDNGATRAFQVTAGNVLPKPSISWPTSVTTNVSATQLTTMYNSALAQRPTSRQPLTPSVPRLERCHRAVVPSGRRRRSTSLVCPPQARQCRGRLVSVTGSRVNCTGTCWGYTYTSLGSGVVANGSLNQTVTIPNNPGVNTLGGWHAIVLIKGAMATDGAGNRVPGVAASSRFKFPST